MRAATGRGRAIKQKIELGCDPSKKLILVMGGSQGSIALNKVVADSLDFLLREGYSVIHSLGQGNPLPDKRDGYFPTPYVTSMSSAYLAADLIIARSGAVTCSEFRTLGRYALFVPLPIGNGEQSLNALDLVDAGRAQIVQQNDFDAHYLQVNIKRLLETSEKTDAQGDSTELLAAEKIVSLVEYVSQGKTDAQKSQRSHRSQNSFHRYWRGWDERPCSHRTFLWH